MKKYLLTFILISFFTFIFWDTNNVYANNYETYFVGSDTLNVRNAGASDAPIVGELVVGDEVKVYREQYGWAEIDFKGEKAWVAVHLLTESPPLNVTVPSDNGPPLMTLENDLPYYATFQQSQTSSEDADDRQKEVDELFQQRYSAKLRNWLHAVGFSEKFPLANMSIILDPGHGGFDPGSTAISGEFEKDLTLRASLAIQDYLRSRGATVFLTRTDDTFVTLENRALFSSIIQADVFISVHFNAFETSNAYGVSSHYAYEDSEQLATYIQAALVKHTQLKDRGALKDSYIVLNENTIPSTLLELGYITTQADFDAIVSPVFNEKVGKAIAEGLQRFFNRQLLAIN